MRDGIGRRTIEALSILAAHGGPMVTGKFMDEFGYVGQRKKRYVDAVRSFLFRLHHKGLVKAYTTQVHPLSKRWEWEISDLGREMLIERRQDAI